MQRCGTKSFGDFFRKNGYRIFSWKQIAEYKIPELFFDNKWIEIIESGIFEDFDVFEDGTFFEPQFSRFLANYIPESKFVYFDRPIEDWFKSMITHSDGLTLGHILRHCYFYDRLEELDFHEKYDKGLKEIKKLPIIGMKDHYSRIYLRHKLQIKAKFKHLDKTRFFSASLYEKDKFERMSNHFGLNLKDTSETKSHVSSKTLSQVVSRYY